jgi:hypothetical protein
MSKTKEGVVEPWKQTCELRPEIRQQQLTLADFAIDLHKVVHGWPGTRPYYCDPERFFSTTYATQNLRQFCKVVLRRLAKQPGGEAIINVAQTFGGGKSHTLTALYYLTTLGKRLPKKDTAVGMILNEAQLKEPPTARVAAVSFDKLDWVKGLEVAAPDGKKRSFRMPWNLIAWQLLGQKGLDIIDRDEKKPDFDTPPADTVWAELIHEVEVKGEPVLILADEFLMWAHDAASRPDGGMEWRDRLKNFWQRLSQAVEGSERSCLVVSLLASLPEKQDEVGLAILNACNNGLNRQASMQAPVERDDLAELLRRRLFVKYPENPAVRQKYILAFWPRMEAVDRVRAKLPNSQQSLIDSYPFHPDLLDRFFGKWVALDQFQRTRGVLQVLALALRDAEKWDDAPVIGPQVFLHAPDKEGLSEALRKLAEVAKDSKNNGNAQWPSNLMTELPRALLAQRAEAGTLTGREIEVACVAAFAYSQPVGELAELSDMRWLLAPTCEMPAVLNNGLVAWAKISWYLEECDTTEAATGVPKIWRLGPKPNLNQLHESYKRRALAHARTRFNELARTKCTPLYNDVGDGVQIHKLPTAPSEVEDDGQFRLVVLGADAAGVVGDPPSARAAEFIRTHSSPSDSRTYQNIVLVTTPSVTGLHQAEQQIADWMAWEEIKGTQQFNEMESFQQEQVKKRERDSLRDALTAVKNAYELVTYLDKDGSVQAKKITMGAQSLFATLLQESGLRLFKEKIEADSIMPGGPYPVWPASDASVRVSELYQEFGKNPKLPKLLSAKTVVSTIEDAVRRGILAARCPRSDGSEQWYWRSSIDVVDWAKTAEAWLPAKAKLNYLTAGAVLPDSLPGLWPKDDSGVKLSTMFSWFDGNHCYEELTQPGYPPEPRQIPKVDFALVKKAAGKAVEEGAIWLVFGNDSVIGEAPTPIQLDPDALLYRPPEPMRPIDLLPPNLANAWSSETEPNTTVATLYAEIKAKRGKPWPLKPFVDCLNAAVGQGFIRRVKGTGPVASLQNDGGVELVIKSEMPKPPEPQPVTPGRRTSTLAVLNAGEVQELGDQVSALAKVLAGSDPQVEVRVTVKSRSDLNLTEANKILDKVKPGWKL